MDIYKQISRSNLKFGKYNIKFFMDDDKRIWFIINNILTILDLKNIPKGVGKKYLQSINNKIYISEAGLVNLIQASSGTNKEKFINWFPKATMAISKYDRYEYMKANEKILRKLRDKVTKLEKEYEELSCARGYPNGGLLYIINHSTKKNKSFEIKIIANKRKEQTLQQDPNVIYVTETNDPKMLLICLSFKLYDHRQRKRHHFNCSLATINKAVRGCTDYKNQKGGGQFIHGEFDKMKTQQIILRDKIRKQREDLLRD